MKTKSIVFLIMICVLILVSGCRDDVEKAELKNPSAKYKMAICSVKSDFKNMLIERLKERYKSLCSIEIIEFENLLNIKSEDYDIIIVMDELQAWMAFNTGIKKFMKKVDKKEKVVLLITAGDPNWKLKDPDIDAISSASEKEKVESVFTEMCNRIDKIIK